MGEMIKGQRRGAEYAESWSVPLFGRKGGVLFISEEQRKELGTDPDGRHGLLGGLCVLLLMLFLEVNTTSNLKCWVLFEIINNCKKQVANKLSTFKNIFLCYLKGDALSVSTELMEMFLKYLFKLNLHKSRME